MIGERYWSTGIVLRYGYAGGGRYGWAAYLDFLDAGFCQDESTQGRLRTRYYVPLELAIDMLHKDATQLAIVFRAIIGDAPMLYYEDDGDSADYPPPDNWRAILREQAERIGWITYPAIEERAQ